MNTKLTATTAQTILNRVAAGESQKNLAVEFGVSPAALSKLVAGKSWPSLVRPAARKPSRHGSKLTEADIQVILQRLMNGEKPRTVALDYGVSRQAAANIQKGKSWGTVPRPEAAPPRPARRRVWETP
jgi:uncharacterized protein (DUF433 family)